MKYKPQTSGRAPLCVRFKTLATHDRTEPFIVLQQKRVLKGFGIYSFTAAQKTEGEIATFSLFPGM